MRGADQARVVVAAVRSETVASLVLAHAGAFWGACVEIRKWLTDLVMLSARNMLAKLAGVSDGDLDNREH